MKIQVLDMHGKKAKEIETTLFDGKIRKDIVQKVAEVEKMNDMQENAPFFLAGNQTSASGNVKHNRHVWKTDRGKGLGRYPKKKMSRSGERFVWVGAVVPGTRGGRRAHPPKLGGRMRKINKKEFDIALKSALAMICSHELLKEKYNSLNEKKSNLALPLVIDSKVLSAKTKEFISALKNIFGENFELIMKRKSIRAGEGKMRGRKYRVSGGALLIIGDNENKTISGLDVIKASDVQIKDFASNGARIVIFTENSIKELEKRI